MKTIPKSLRPSVVALLALLLSPVSRAAGPTSDLWGASGERWTPASRLPDFSQAGYRRGEESYRIPTDVVSVKDLGAKGDGTTDDTEAFKQAIASGPDKLVLIPPGRYVLTDMIEIKQPRIVLRGAGMNDTVLLCTRPLQEIKPEAAVNGDGKQVSAYSWSGGLIKISGQSLEEGPRVPVVADAKRGDAKLKLAGHSFKVGDEVLLKVMDSPAMTLIDHLHRGQAHDFRPGSLKVSQQVFRLNAVNGDEITLDRALRFDVRLEWRPDVGLFAPKVTDVGLEELSFEFPAKPYPGHFEETGFNPVAATSKVAHCWLRKVRVWNADNGPFISGWFCSVDGIILGADRKREVKDGISGHHGVTLNGSDSLCTNFHIDTRFHHDATVDAGATGNVFSKGDALDFNMDHHKSGPYENLFTDIDAGEGSRLFASGGASGHGNPTAAGATFWNIRSKQEAVWPENFALDAMNFVALKMRGRDIKSAEGRWIETIRPGAINPPDLHLAMRQKRLATQPQPGGTHQPLVEAAFHSWTSSDGRVIEAQFGGMKGEQVTLMRDGKSFQIPLSRLAVESQSLARRLSEAGKAR